MKQEVNGDIVDGFEQFIADKGEKLVQLPKKKILDKDGKEIK